MLNFSVRIFGSNDCDRCNSVKKAFEFYNIEYEYFDANDPQHEKLCDEHGVDELPHIEAFFTKNNLTFYKYVGYINPLTFLERAVVTNSQIEKFFDKTLDAAKNDVDLNKLNADLEEIRKKGGCASCKKKKNVE